MTNERMMILEMIKDGKISVDDGVKLLNALNKNNSSNFDDFANDIKYKIYNMPKPNTEKIKENAQIIINKTEGLFDDFTKSIKDFFNTSNEPSNTNYNTTTINVDPVDNNTNNNDNNHNDDNFNKN
ncbi:hypothetical protein [uncultured Tyzzerella sp.]|uniref:SHOCT-like domain-containing protein n=1 Tax=uncultured Tyzzerella sp. TaxID=2321398 RepID=UPI002942BFD8|nr:hypothetical protein [uncultured Tyzzerella sp.]